MCEVTFKSAKYHKVDQLSDYERRELDCWIAKHIEGYPVSHLADLKPVGYRDNDPYENMRLSDLAYKDFLKEYPNHKPVAKGPYLVLHYSFSPSIALNVFQTNTELSTGWNFGFEKGYWSADNSGLLIAKCKSLALCLMLALKHEWEFRHSKSLVIADHSAPGPSPLLGEDHPKYVYPAVPSQETLREQENNNEKPK